MKKRTLRTAAGGAVLALVLAACGGGSGGGATGSNANANDGLKSIVNASNKTGGVLRLAHSDDVDSYDPGNMYYAQALDFMRLYGRSLTAFKEAPGAASTQVVPDLAQSLGKSENGNKTWTYKLRPDVKFEDGTVVTSKDVKYAVERTFDRDVLPNGPEYFSSLMDPKYPGAFKDKSPDKLGLKDIETPDDQTIVFKLRSAFPDFDYMLTMGMTVPVPKAKDRGKDYELHPVSTGPYMFQTHDPGKKVVLVKNPQWNPGNDPLRKQLVDRIELDLGVNQDDIDSRLINGSLDVDFQGNGPNPAVQAKLLSDPTLKKATDNPTLPRNSYTAINTKVAPLNNIHCRMAVEYAADKTAMQTGYGGPVAGGDIAPTLLPPAVPVPERTPELYPDGPEHHGDVAKAKQELQACGQPSGFSTKISARADRGKEVKAAEALQQSLAKVGIKTEIKTFPSSKYLTDFAGSPDYVHRNGLGLMMMSWASDWPTGFGYLSQITDGRAIKAQGNSNIQELNDPQINQLWDKVATLTSEPEREKIYAQIDRKVMESATVLPVIYNKVLLYRPPTLTNVYISTGYTGQYDFAILGKK